MSNGKLHHAALPAGYRLHWYEIESILGQGGFGITYLANDVNLEQKVAIKEFLPTDLAVRTHDSSVVPMSDGHRDTFGWGLSRFITEAKTLAKFTHPNIVSVLSVFEENNTAYMVMAYVEGQTLEDALKFQRISTESQLLGITLSLLDGLAQIHGAGFIHRDIKPANIFLRDDETPVLLDFGSARQALGSQTRTLTALVSPGYAPFEQYGASKEKDTQGPWSDIYALGATLYRAVSGRGPIDAIERANSLMSGKPDLLISAVELGKDRYSEHFLEAIDWALEFMPENRPQDVAAWRAALLGEVRVRHPQDAQTVIAPSGDGQHAGPAILTPSPQAIADGTRRLGKKRLLRVLTPVVLVLLIAAGWLLRPASVEQPEASSASNAPTSGSADELAALQRSVADKKAKLEALEAQAEARTQQQLVEKEMARLAEEKRLAEEAARIAEEKRLGEEAGAGEEKRLAAPAAATTSLAQIEGGPEERQQTLEPAQATLTEAPQPEESPTLAESRDTPPETQSAGENNDATATNLDTPEDSTASAPVVDTQIETLLAAADTDLAALRLTSPADNNAFAKYSRVLEWQPGNQSARTGLENIVAAYVRLIDRSLEKGDLTRAEQYLQSGASVLPESQLLADAQARVSQLRESRLATESPNSGTVGSEKTAPSQVAKASTENVTQPTSGGHIDLLSPQHTPLQIGNNKIDYGLDRGVAKVANRQFVGGSHTMVFQLPSLPPSGGVLEIETVDVTSESSCYQYVDLNGHSLRFFDDGVNGVNRFDFPASNFLKGANRVTITSKNCQDEVVVVNDFVLISAFIRLK